MIHSPRPLQLAGLISIICGALANQSLYPFGERAGDSMMDEMDDGSSPKLVTPDKYSVFESRDRRVFVNENGVVSLHTYFDEFYAEPLPISPDVLVAPFWVDHYVGHDMGKVWFRLSKEKKDIRRAKNNVRDNFDGCNDNFKPKVVLVATWEDVHSFEYIDYHYYGQYYDDGGVKREAQNAERDQQRSLDEPNTYQVVLMTDGVETFAMFNYEKINWLDSDDNRAVVGFNAGDGVTSWEHPLSRTLDLADLVTGSNLNPAVHGRWMYKISGNTILGPNCEAA